MIFTIAITFIFVTSLSSNPASRDVSVLSNASLHEPGLAANSSGVSPDSDMADTTESSRVSSTFSFSPETGRPEGSHEEGRLEEICINT